MLHENSSLWVCVLGGKYMKNNMQIDNMVPKHGSSNVWRDIVQAKSILFKGFKKWFVTEEELIWLDIWVDD